MKKSAILFLFIIVSFGSQAQQDNWYFSFSMGGSWPSGTFSQTNMADNKSGYAQKGFSLLIDATYPLNDHFGLKGLTLINTNTIDNNEMEKMLINRVPSTISAGDASKFSFTTNPWMWNSVVAGPVYTLNLGRLYWDLQLLGGLNVTYLPEQKLQYNDTSVKWYYSDKNTTSTDLSWGILGGTALRFPISERINFKVGVNYYLSSAHIEYQQTRVSQEAESVLTEHLGSGSTLIPIRMVTGTLGFVYYLN